MRILFIAAALTFACAEADPVEPGVHEDIAPAEQDLHVCRAYAHEALSRDEPWSPGDLDDCMAGCERGDAEGYDQGRLVCILEGEFCAECVADQPQGEAYSLGYKSCFGDAYSLGYGDEGCAAP